jgi:hypothetical protein
VPGIGCYVVADGGEVYGRGEQGHSQPTAWSLTSASCAGLALRNRRLQAMNRWTLIGHAVAFG